MHDVPLAQARHGPVPPGRAQVGSAPLQNLPHGDQQAGPAQVVVRRGEGLGLGANTGLTGQPRRLKQKLSTAPVPAEPPAAVLSSAVEAELLLLNIDALKMQTR